MPATKSEHPFQDIAETATLFDSNSQYREKAAIWKIVSLLPLRAGLSAGRVWRWFAINIPMDLGADGRFTSDIDILAPMPLGTS
jgi:hypothetical protein